MPTIASLQELETVYTYIKHLSELHREFYLKIVKILEYTRAADFEFGFFCKLIIDEEYNGSKPLSQRRMPRQYTTNSIPLFAEISRLIQKQQESKERVIYTYIMQLRKDFFDVYSEFADFLADNRMTGYNNICRMILGETPLQVYKYGKYTTRKEEII